MNAIQIQAHLPHIKPVNLWALRGESPTLIDTGRRSNEALTALETGLRRERLRIGDLEIVIPTRHNLDHSGLIATAFGRPDARAAGLDLLADSDVGLVERSATARSFSVKLMRHHSVPETAIEANEGFWDFIPDFCEAFATHIAVTDGGVIAAGGQRPRLRRRSSARGHLVAARDRARGGAHRIAASGTDRVPENPEADRVDAARAAADRSRRPGHRVTPPLLLRS
jgi:hypothetical protein